MIYLIYNMIYLIYIYIHISSRITISYYIHLSGLRTISLRHCRAEGWEPSSFASCSIWVASRRHFFVFFRKLGRCKKTPPERVILHDFTGKDGRLYMILLEKIHRWSIVHGFTGKEGKKDQKLY